jgi:hypothetical protein
MSMSPAISPRVRRAAAQASRRKGWATESDVDAASADDSSSVAYLAAGAATGAGAAGAAGILAAAPAIVAPAAVLVAPNGAAVVAGALTAGVQKIPLEAKTDGVVTAASDNAARRRSHERRRLSSGAPEGNGADRGISTALGAGAASASAQAAAAARRKPRRQFYTVHFRKAEFEIDVRCVSVVVVTVWAMTAFAHTRGLQTAESHFVVAPGGARRRRSWGGGDVQYQHTNRCATIEGTKIASTCGRGRTAAYARPSTHWTAARHVATRRCLVGIPNPVAVVVVIAVVVVVRIVSISSPGDTTSPHK